MKVLFDSYSTVFQNKSGGMQQRIKKIASLLTERGIKVGYFDKFSTRLEEYDVLHVFMLNMENYTIIKAMKSLGKKVVISSVIPNQNTRKTDVIRKQIGRYYSGSALYYVTQCAHMADAIICETPREARYFQSFYGVSASKIHIIPNGMPTLSEATNIIYDLIGGEREYVLQVGRFDENKNQLRVIRAMKNTGIHVVFIGGPNVTERNSYYEACLKEGKEDPFYHFLGWHDDSDGVLQSAYAHAQLLVVPSFMETFGLVLLEGGAAGAKLAMSNTIPIGEYPVFDKCQKFDPNDVADIRKKILCALSEPVDDGLIDRLEDTFSWKSVIDQHIDLYGR